MWQRLNLFWRYFLTGFICILLSVVATFVVMEKLKQRDNRSTFAEETARELQEMEDLGVTQFTAAHQNSDFAFDISVADTLSPEFDGKINQVYQYGYNQFGVIYHSPELGYVTIKDKPAQYDEIDRTQAWFARLERIIWLGVIMLFLGLGFYLVNRQTQRHIKRLVNASKSISEGDFDTQVPTQSPEPIQQLALQLDTTRKNLKHFLEKERTLAFAMPHELRTPVSKIRLALELSRDHETVADYERLVEDLDAYTDELEQLINDLLALAKTNDSVVLSTISLPEILDDFASEYHRLYPSKTLSIHNDVKQLHSGELQLRLILSNLIQNAFKYADAVITLTVTQTADAVIIRIANDGKAIPAEMREAIFDPFTRVDASRNRQTGGVGLGLALAKQAVSQLGGRIALLDNDLTCFEVVFPKG